MRARFRSPLFAAALLAGALGARDARAFVRSVSDAGNQLYWSTSCETVTIYMNGYADMTADEVAKSIGAAAATWGPTEVTCPTPAGSHPFFTILPQMAKDGATPPTVHNDGQNTIAFETASFDAGMEVLAATTTWKEPDGHIVDADIRINAVPGATPLGNLDPGAPLSRHGQVLVDLQTLMTHELGHFLGLAHTCDVGPYMGDDSGDQPKDGVDDQGNPIPDCTPYPSASIAKQAAAVMWYLIDSGSIAKRVLTADDAAGVCAIYPAAADPHACTQNTPDDGCGCAAAGTAPGSAASALALGLALGAARRRRPRSRR
ncbi:MAG TPA: MYXO-CTERM sorting domain-containing protein [Polyangia bacterium]|nr:MYXO-CTERM sorting domain-containing protein [Polyangia bacterium]